MNLYITADRIGEKTGGGIVTYHERDALISLGVTSSISIDHTKPPKDPFAQDAEMLDRIKWLTITGKENWKIAHCYAGCLTNTVKFLKQTGCKVTYTAAAHSIEISRQEHEKLGIPFDYPHLNNPELWKQYLGGYLEADVLICPSTHSAKIMREYGRTGRIEVIPHGVELPKEIAPYPDKFTVGYLGAIGPDKGVRYLLEAWKKLNYKDAQLVIAGRDSTSPFMQYLTANFGYANVNLAGWVNNISDFYNSISCYVQCSASEGFGIEVLEAMAHGRPTLCSVGAGAADTVPTSWTFPACDSDALASAIDKAKNAISIQRDKNLLARIWIENTTDFTWDKIKQRYVDLWKSLL